MSRRNQLPPVQAEHTGSYVKYLVPDGEEPAGRCPYCDRPFAAEDILALHVGERHADQATDDERVAYEAARRDESDELFVYHLKVVAALVLTFMAFAYAYAFAWS